jgi:hypothetical protein
MQWVGGLVKTTNSIDSISKKKLPHPPHHIAFPCMIVKQAALCVAGSKAQNITASCCDGDDGGAR